LACCRSLHRCLFGIDGEAHVEHGDQMRHSELAEDVPTALIVGATEYDIEVVHALCDIRVSDLSADRLHIRAECYSAVCSTGGARTAARQQRIWRRRLRPQTPRSPRTSSTPLRPHPATARDDAVAALAGTASETERVFIDAAQVAADFETMTVAEQRKILGAIVDEITVKRGRGPVREAGARYLPRARPGADLVRGA